MPHVVVVAMTVDIDDPDEAVEFVRAELLSRLGGEEPRWQTEQPHLLPRWQITRVHRTARLDERGGLAE